MTLMNTSDKTMQPLSNAEALLELITIFRDEQSDNQKFRAQVITRFDTIDRQLVAIEKEIQLMLCIHSPPFYDLSTIHNPGL